MTRAYGSGSVYRRSSDGRWVGAVVVAGKRRVVSGATRMATQRRMDDLKASALQGFSPADQRLTAGRHLLLWLDSVRPTVRPSTWESYEGHVRLHLGAISAVPLVQLSPNHVRRLIQDRLAENCAPRTVSYTLTVLRMALKQAVRDGLIPRNVALLVDPPDVPRHELRLIRLGDAQRLLAIESAFGPLWAILVGTGLRLSVGLGLRWSDIDLTARSLTVRVALRPIPRHARPDAQKWARTGQRLKLTEPKTPASRRTIALPSFVVRALVAQRKAQGVQPTNIDGLVFTTPRGTPIDARNVSRAFDRDRQRAGPQPMRLHDLRHAAASLMLSQGFTLDDVKRVLGHSSITLTSDTYGHLVEGRSREIADGMDRALGG